MQKLKSILKLNSRNSNLIKSGLDSGYHFSRKNKNVKRVVKDFLTHSINVGHCRSRLLLFNKAKDQISDIEDLKTINIMGTMQKLIETSILHHLKNAMTKTFPFQFGFKPDTGTGEAILRLNIKIRQLILNEEASGFFLQTSRKHSTAPIFTLLMNFIMKFDSFTK